MLIFISIFAAVFKPFAVVINLSQLYISFTSNMRFLNFFYSRQCIKIYFIVYFNYSYSYFKKSTPGTFFEYRYIFNPILSVRIYVINKFFVFLNFFRILIASLPNRVRCINVLYTFFILYLYNFYLFFYWFLQCIAIALYNINISQLSCGFYALFIFYFNVSSSYFFLPCLKQLLAFSLIRVGLTLLEFYRTPYKFPSFFLYYVYVV